MFLYQDILFNDEECKMIISEYDDTYRLWDKVDRKYQSSTITHSNETKWLFDRLIYFFESHTQEKITNIHEFIHFHKFTKSDWFDLHNDNINDRTYGIGVLLSDDFNGGDFKLFNPNEVSLNKTCGNSYIFDVKIPHKIEPILNGNRYSLLWFLHRNNLRIKKTLI